MKLPFETIISYIKNSVNVMVTALAEAKVDEYKSQSDNKQQTYESMLIKLEKDIRKHIQSEQQVKLYVESLEYEMQELERENTKLKSEVRKLQEQLTQLNNNNNTHSSLLNELKQMLNESKAQVRKYIDNETSLQCKLNSKQQEIQSLQDKHNNQLQQLNRIINEQERTIKQYQQCTPINKGNVSCSYKHIPKTTIHHNHNHNQRQQNSTSMYNTIEKLIQNKISSIKHSYSSVKHSNSSCSSSKNNIAKIEHSRDKSLSSFFIQNDSLLLSHNNNKHDDMPNKSDCGVNSHVKGIHMHTAKKKGMHNRYRSLEDVKKIFQNKTACKLVRDILCNNNNNNGSKGSESNLNKSYYINQQGRKRSVEMVNNINIYMDSVKQDNHSVYVKVNNIDNNNNYNMNNNHKVRTKLKHKIPIKQNKY